MYLDYAFQQEGDRQRRRSLERSRKAIERSRTNREIKAIRDFVSQEVNEEATP